LLFAEVHHTYEVNKYNNNSKLKDLNEKGESLKGGGNVLEDCLQSYLPSPEIPHLVANEL
jgi:hypothetical protein